MQARSSSGICSTEPNPMRWPSAERAEWGGGCSAVQVSGEKVEEDELTASASFGGKLLREESGTEASFAAVDARRR